MEKNIRVLVDQGSSGLEPVGTSGESSSTNSKATKGKVNKKSSGSTKKRKGRQEPRAMQGRRYLERLRAEQAKEKEKEREKEQEQAQAQALSVSQQAAQFVQPLPPMPSQHITQPYHCHQGCSSSPSPATPSSDAKSSVSPPQAFYKYPCYNCPGYYQYPESNFGGQYNNPMGYVYPPPPTAMPAPPMPRKVDFHSLLTAQSSQFMTNSNTENETGRRSSSTEEEKE